MYSKSFTDQYLSHSNEAKSFWILLIYLPLQVFHLPTQCLILFALNANIYFIPFGSLLNFANLPGKGAFCGGIQASKVLKLSPFRASGCGSVGRAVAPISKVLSSNPAISKNYIERYCPVNCIERMKIKQRSGIAINFFSIQQTDTSQHQCKHLPISETISTQHNHSTQK